MKPDKKMEPPRREMVMNQLCELRSQMDNLSKDLFKAMESIQNEWILPDAGLKDTLQYVQILFESTRNILLEYIQSIQLPIKLVENQKFSLMALEGLFQKSEEHLQNLNEEKKYNQILEILLKVSCIRYKDGQEFPALSPCHIQARELVEALQALETDKNSEWDALIKGTHPLTVLIKLVENGERLNEEECNDCFEKLASTYGKTLALAAVRGRLEVFIAKELGESSLTMERKKELTQRLLKLKFKKILNRGRRVSQFSVKDNSSL